jgi:hypothetical protein
MHRTVLGFTWKRESMLLAGETAVTHLIEMIDMWQTIHHVVISQAPQPPKI